MATASTTKENMKDKIGQTCSKITIELIKVKHFSEDYDYAYNKKINISNIY